VPERQKGGQLASALALRRFLPSLESEGIKRQGFEHLVVKKFPAIVSLIVSETRLARCGVTADCADFEVLLLYCCGHLITIRKAKTDRLEPPPPRGDGHRTAPLYQMNHYSECSHLIRLLDSSKFQQKRTRQRGTWFFLWENTGADQ
jgi:hypothetical protein